MIAERLKYQGNIRMIVNNYFWRTYDQQEIDWVEERGGKLFGFEFKWNPKKMKPPASWQKSYSNASFKVVSKENYREFVSD